EVVACGIEGDAIEPAGESGATIKTGQAGGETHADRLRHVFGVALVAKDAIGHAKNKPVLGGDKLVEGSLVSPLGARDQSFEVWSFCCCLLNVPVSLTRRPRICA